MKKMDNAHFQELARRDRNKLIAGIAVAAILSLALSFFGTDLRNITLDTAIRAPLLIAVFAGGGFLAMRLTKKMEKDSFEEGMYLTLEGVPMACTMMDGKGTPMFCNEAAPKAVGLPTKQVFFEKLMTELMPEFQPDGMRTMEIVGRHMGIALQKGTSKLEFWQGTAQKGKMIPCEVNLVSSSVYGEPRLMIYTRDMSESHEIKKKEDALKERMQAILDSSPMVCAVYDEQGNALDVSKEAENLFDIPDRMFFVTNYNDLLPERQPDGTNSIQRNADAIKRAQKDGDYRFEFMYQRKDGTPIPTEEIVNSVVVGGNPLFIVYSRDMRKEYAAKEAEQAAQKKLQSMTDRLNGQLETQSSAITESSAAIEQMVANTRSVSNTLSKNAQNVKELQEAAAVGQSSLNEVATDFREIARESESLLEINSVMQNIASQTNLLSMNAAIEAAHAGESGRGFAVVADEIRKLAESSSRQSKTIGGVLKKIKSSIDKITKSTDSVMNKFEAIDDGVKTVAQQEHGMMNAMAEQSAGSTQIMQAIAQVNDITGQVKEDARQMVEAAAKLGV